MAASIEAVADGAGTSLHSGETDDLIHCFDECLSSIPILGKKSPVWPSFSYLITNHAVKCLWSHAVFSQAA